MARTIQTGLKSADPLADRRKTILLVGEDCPLLRMVSHTLKEAGHELILASNGFEAIQKAQDFSDEIDLLLSDLETAGMTGLELSIQIHLVRPFTKIFLMTHLESGLLLISNGWEFLPNPLVAEVLKEKVAGILKTGEDPNEHRSPAKSKQLVNDRTRSLSKREIEVLKLVAAGHSTKEIASLLDIAFKTAVGHRTRLMRKLEVHDAVALVRYAFRAGLAEA